MKDRYNLYNRGVCRNIQRGLNNPCSFGIPIEDSCLFFGDRRFGYTVQRAGYGRKISKEEAIDILQMTTEKGVLTLREKGISCCSGWKSLKEGM